MENKLECEIVRDLLPSYADGLTSEVTSRAVREHLDGCAQCAEALRLMREPEAPEEHTPEVDYLKKVRRRTLRSGIIWGAAALIIGMAIICIKVFLFGTALNPGSGTLAVSVSGETVRIEGSTGSYALAVARVALEESNGVVSVKVYTAPKMFFNSGELEKEYKAKGEVKQVCWGELTLWDDGAPISETAAALYAAKNPYVGDMPANIKIADILGISTRLGGFTSELATAQEPLGWRIYLSNPIISGQESAAKSIMEADSYAMLAAIENLGYVEWHYSVDGEAGEYRVTQEEASAFAGGDIKAAAASPKALEALVSRLGIGRYGLYRAEGEERSLDLNIRVECRDVYSLSMDYCLDGKVIGTRSVSNADGSVLKSGDTLRFDYTEGDLVSGAGSAMLSGFSFNLRAMDNYGNSYDVCDGVSADAAFGQSIDYVLTGSFEDGFTLTEK